VRPGGIRIAFLQRVPEETKSVKGLGARPASVLTVVILAAMGIWFWACRGNEPGGQTNGEPRILSTLHLETFVLNLADPDQRAYLRVGIDLGLSRELKRDEAAPIAQVRDTILAVLGQAKGDEIVTAQGKDKLKQDLLRALQERVPQLGVEEIYFTEFLIQR
jgi:flagellar basal body-associated protein FliL